MDTSLEHFVHIEDVVRFIKTHLPEGHGPEHWKNVCEDVLHCELTKVEPLLLKQLGQAQDAKEADQIRELLRAASWYTHPQLTTEELLARVTQLTVDPSIQTAFPAGNLEVVTQALKEHVSGTAVLPAAKAMEQLIEYFASSPEQTTLLTSAHEIRDQLYYQLLYPHWFEIVKQWTSSQATSVRT